MSEFKTRPEEILQAAEMNGFFPYEIAEMYGISEYQVMQELGRVERTNELSGEDRKRIMQLGEGRTLIGTKI